MAKSVVPVETPIEALITIARRYGTPTYAYDVGQMRAKVAWLRANIPPAVEILYCLKANPSLGLCSLMAAWGLGADVASAGELTTALTADFPPSRIFVGGPYKSAETLAQLRSLPEITLSVDSLSELRSLSGCEQPWRIILRLRPDFSSSAAVATGMHSRFGIPFEDLPRCREQIGAGTIVGFHVFAGSQVLDATAAVRHLHGALDLSLRAADLLGMVPQIFNLGGGFGVPYCLGDQELDLAPIADELARSLDRISPARVVLELGRYLVAQAGWYLTAVVAHQTHQGRAAVVVDGGTNQRTDVCRLGLRTKAYPPVLLATSKSETAATDVLGCLCLPDDILTEASPLPPLNVGDVLAFPNAGAYGLSASPTLFLGHPCPAEVAFEGIITHLLRPRQSARSILEGQTQLSPAFGIRK